MKPELVFLGWSQPWVEALVAWLWAKPGALRRRLVVVPTRESGRRLRERLVERASHDGKGAILGPHLATPDDFFRPETAMPDAVRWAGWVQVLRSTPDEAVANLFPGGIAARDDSWRAGIARRIEEARETLLAGNLTLPEVAEVFPEEAGRWTELSRLEQRVLDAWRAWGFADPIRAKRERALNPVLPTGVDEVIIAGVADPLPIAVESWKRLLARGARLAVLVPAPENLRPVFDDWGRPDRVAWTDRTKHPTPEASAVRVAADPRGLAEATVQACAARTNREVAVGVCDTAFAPAVAARFQEAGWTVFSPGGIPLARDGWPELLEALAEAADSPNDHAALSRVAHHPAVWDEALRNTDPQAVLGALEDWESNHGAAEAAVSIAGLANSSVKGEARSFEKSAAQLLGQIRQLTEAAATGDSARLEDQLRHWLGKAEPAVAEMAAAEMAAWPALQRTQFRLPLRLRWLAASLSALSRNPDPTDAHLSLDGWLELLYAPGQHLVIAAMHEGSVPEAPSAHPLVTEALQEKLGLRDRASRLARETFLYTNLLESRRAGGSVTVVTAQVDPQGEPCRPSRVLLHATPEDLSARVKLFIKGQADVPLQPTPAWARGDWSLSPPPEGQAQKVFTHLSPSRIKSYLACPTRFYFEQVLGWEEFQPFTGELNGARFGDLIHNVLKEWGEDASAREYDDPEKLIACWLYLLDRQVKTLFGESLPPLLQFQVLSARERLTALASLQAAERRQGWRIIAAEKEFKGVLRLAGLPLELRIDRIDRHEDGRVRVIDYKTAREGATPRKAHLRVWSAETSPTPLGPLVIDGKKSYGWADLQLPLYAHTLKQDMGLAEAPQAYYVLLPEAVTDTEFAEFKGLAELMDNAWEWAAEAARRIVDGVFWPPAPEAQFDFLEAMAPEGLEPALGEAWRRRLSGKPATKGGIA